MAKTDNWKEIIGFPGYQVNEKGEIVSLHYLHHNMTRKLKLRKSRNGYYSVCLYKDGKAYSKLIHRIVAQTFIPNPNNFPQVNHIDGDKGNNNVSNLEWVSNSGNIKHAIRNNLISKERLINTTEAMSKNNRKAVLQFDIQGKFIARYNSAQEAALMNNLSNVSACCRGKYKTTGGYIWRYEK